MTPGTILLIMKIVNRPFVSPLFNTRTNMHVVRYCTDASAVGNGKCMRANLLITLSRLETS